MRVLPLLLFALLLLAVVTSCVNAILKEPPPPLAPVEDDEALRGAQAQAQDHHHHFDDILDDMPKKKFKVNRVQHECIHHEIAAIQDEREKREGGPVVGKFAHPDGREAVSLGIGNIRIVIKTPDLFDSTQYCTAASGTVNDKKTVSGTVSCAATEDILTTAKRDLLINTIIPAGVQMLENAIQVDQLSGNLMVSSTGTCGGEWKIDSADVSTGIANADFVLYVAAAPIGGSTLAFAGACGSITASGRPLVGRMNFAPKHIVWDDNDPYSQEDAKRTIAHEILHALGFSSGSSSIMKPSKRHTVTRRGNSGIVEFRGTKSLEVVKEYTGCSTVTGVELETHGNSLAHVSRAQFRDSVMAAIIGYSRLDKIVLAMLEDYDVGYTINYSAAEFMTWGNHSYHNAGCGYVDDKAGAATAPLGDWCGDFPCHYCDQVNNTMISVDRRYKGYCTWLNSLSGIPTQYQHFGVATTGGKESPGDLMEFVPYVRNYASTVCDDTTNSNSGSNGERFTTNSKAVSTVGIRNSGSSSTRVPRCVEFRCKTIDFGANWFLQFRLGNDAVFSNCSIDGTFGPANPDSATSFVGIVDCPKASTLCNPDYPDMFLYDFVVPTTSTASPPSPGSPGSPGSPVGGPGATTTSTSAPGGPSPPASSGSVSTFACSVVVAALLMAIVFQ